MSRSEGVGTEVPTPRYSSMAIKSATRELGLVVAGDHRPRDALDHGDRCAILQEGVHGVEGHLAVRLERHVVCSQEAVVLGQLYTSQRPVHTHAERVLLRHVLGLSLIHI